MFNVFIFVFRLYLSLESRNSGVYSFFSEAEETITISSQDGTLSWAWLQFCSECVNTISTPEGTLTPSSKSGVVGFIWNCFIGAGLMDCQGKALPWLPALFLSSWSFASLSPSDREEVWRRTTGHLAKRIQNFTFYTGPEAGVLGPSQHRFFRWTL